jgi:exopolysaccharide production protein ExoZ
LSKIQNIQALRGIAVLLVVLMHSLHIEQKYGGAQSILPHFFQFGMAGVDLFFVISGFVMVTVTRGKFQNPRASLRFTYHRMARIYPTYWVYTLLLLIVYFIRPTWINAAGGNQVDILASFLLLPSHILPLVVVGWTLIHEVYFYLVFAVILLLVPERRLAYAVVLWGCAVSLVNSLSHSNSPWVSLISHPLTLEFIGGCLIAIVHFSTDVKVRTETLLLLATAGAAVSFGGFQYYQHVTGSVILSDWWRVAILGIPALAVVYCLSNAEKNGYVIHSALVLVGDASYSIYLSHILTLSTFGRMWSLFATDTLVDNFIMVPALYGLVLLVGFLSYRMVEKPLLRLSRRIA